MPIKLEFLKEKGVLLQTYSNPLDAAQMSDLKNTMNSQILSSVTSKVHIIADFSRVTNLPGTILTSGVYMLDNAHPNTGAIICVTGNNFVRRVAQIFSRITPRHRVIVVKSLEEALKEIDKLRATEPQ